MSVNKPANIILNELKLKWQQLQQVPNVFSYQFKVSESKYLAGKYYFHLQLNPERTALRRPPQTIMSLNPTFEEEKFNFKKVAEQEILMKLKFDDETDISFIINNSPLTLYHTLICPNVEMGLGQRITVNSLRFCVYFLLSLEENRYFRIGYNSPGALASVNHLHLQLLFMDKELYVDRVQLQHLAEPDIYRFDETMPTEAICFMFDNTETEAKTDTKVKKLNTFLQWLCDSNIPHNLFMTPHKQKDNVTLKQQLKILVYAREEFCFVKDLKKCNVGFCELSGYVTVGEYQINIELMLPENFRWCCRRQIELRLLVHECGDGRQANLLQQLNSVSILAHAPWITTVLDAVESKGITANISPLSSGNYFKIFVSIVVFLLN